MSSTGLADASQYDQWLRKVSLIVADASGNGLDLSQFRVKFKITQSDFETPNACDIRVYNLAQDTRGNEFYTTLTCLSIDKTQSSGGKKAAG